MRQDRELDKVSFLSPEVRARLKSLEIRTIRQLFCRLDRDQAELRAFLELSTEAFAALRAHVAALVQQEFPQDAVPRIFPTVNKRGVAVHRLRERARS